MIATFGAVLAVASLGAGILVRGAGGGSTADGGSQSSGGAAARPDSVSIKDFKFMPAAIEVTVGTKVTFTNDDRAAHTATADAFDTGSIKKGEKKAITLNQAGSMAYICSFHPYMKGTVIVK